MNITSFLEYLQNKEPTNKQYVVLGGFVPGQDHPLINIGESTVSEADDEEMKTGIQERDVSKTPILFDDNDVHFLYQFPYKYINSAMHWRYGAGLKQLYNSWKKGTLQDKVDVILNLNNGGTVRFKQIRHHMIPLFNKLFSKTTAALTQGPELFKTGGLYGFDIDEYVPLELDSWNTPMAMWESSIVGGLQGESDTGALSVLTTKRGIWGTPEVNVKGQVIHPKAELIHNDPDLVARLIENQERVKQTATGQLGVHHEYEEIELGANGEVVSSKPKNEISVMPVLTPGRVVSASTYREFERNKIIMLRDLGLVNLQLPPNATEDDMDTLIFGKSGHPSKKVLISPNTDVLRKVFTETTPFVHIDDIANMPDTFADMTKAMERFNKMKGYSQKIIDNPIKIEDLSLRIQTGQKGAAKPMERKIMGGVDPQSKEKTLKPIRNETLKEIGRRVGRNITKREYRDIVDKYFIGSKSAQKTRQPKDKAKYQSLRYDVEVLNYNDKPKSCQIPAGVYLAIMTLDEKTGTDETSPLARHVESLYAEAPNLIKGAMDYCKLQDGYPDVAEFVAHVLQFGPYQKLNREQAEVRQDLYRRHNERIRERSRSFTFAACQLAFQYVDEETKQVTQTLSRREREKLGTGLSMQYKGGEESGEFGSTISRGQDKARISSREESPESTFKNRSYITDKGVIWAREPINVLKQREIAAKREAEELAAEMQKQKNKIDAAPEDSDVDNLEIDIANNQSTMMARTMLASRAIINLHMAEVIQNSKNLDSIDLTRELEVAKQKANDFLKKYFIEDKTGMTMSKEEEEEIKRFAKEQIGKLQHTNAPSQPMQIHPAPAQGINLSKMTPQQIIDAVKNPQTSAAVIADVQRNPTSKNVLMNLIQNAPDVPSRNALAAILAVASKTEIKGREMEAPEAPESGETPSEEEPMSADEMARRKAAWLASKRRTA